VGTARGQPKLIGERGSLLRRSNLRQSPLNRVSYRNEEGGGGGVVGGGVGLGGGWGCGGGGGRIGNRLE